MFLIVKMALVTCAFYVGIAFLINAIFFGFTVWKGGLLYTLDSRLWALVFGIVWLISFILAWRVVMTPLLAKFPRPPIA